MSGARSDLVLVIGGARSGKSRYALARGESRPGPRTFVATAEARDDEMAARIARHRAERGSGWRTLEAPLDLAGLLRRMDDGVLLVDCLTLWLANRMGDDPHADVVPSIDELVNALAARRASVIAVTNEVGLGIVPENALARAFRDAAGMLNRRVAEIADEVQLLVAGVAVRIR